MTICKFSTLACASLGTFAILTAAAIAASPNVQTPSPVIYLADNLDEKDQLGWCIDTLGRGFAEELQAHSCKPNGGDVQFSIDAASQQIRSVEFDGKCMTLSAPENGAVPFGLKDCVADEPSQKYVYDQATMQIRFAGDEAKCVSVAAQSRSAGPFMSRDLKLTPCADTDDILMKWVVRE
ncbi:MAG: ricin-type beta-trefoil lectin domain protein [Pseudomonadota bacterium]